MKIGIFMAYGPDTVMRKEGLGRYIGSLIKGFLDAGHEVTIACPKWSLDTIDDLFQDLNIDPKKVEFIVSSKTPLLWRLYSRRYKKRHKSRNLKVKVLNCFADYLGWSLELLTSATSYTVFLAVLLMLALAAVVLLPLGAVGMLLFLAARFIISKIRKVKFSAKEYAFRLGEFFLQYSSSRYKNFIGILVNNRGKLVEESIVQKINHAQKRDVWFVPSIFWPGISNIQALTVVNAPDLVTQDFPLNFADIFNNGESTLICRKTIDSEKYFITYCEHLKNALLVRDFGKEPENVQVIPHANNSMKAYTEITPALNQQYQSSKDFSMEFSRALMQGAMGKCRSVSREYIKGFNVHDTRYIFYASQVRPHKNLMTLLKAYNELLRRRYKQVKLVVTGNLTLDESRAYYAYIKENRLEYDVLSLPDLTAQELAAFYQCAELVVNPTLYEGGFPFTFGEGMSVGTPSIMSDIPQVRDVIEPAGLAEDMLFDPYDWVGLADKMEWALDHRQELYEKELPLYTEMAQRTEAVVAEDYAKAFAYFVQLDKQKGTQA